MLQHFPDEEKHAKHRAPFRRSEALLSRGSTYGEASMQVCWEKNISLVSLHLLNLGVKISRGFTKTAANVLLLCRDYQYATTK